MSEALMSFKLPYTLEKGEDSYVSCCPILDVYSCGDTDREAVENLVEAVAAFLETCWDMGTFDEVLKSCGFTPNDQTAAHDESEPSIEVPINLIARNALEAHAC